MDKKSGESFPKFELPAVEGQELEQEKSREKRIKLEKRDKSLKTTQTKPKVVNSSTDTTLAIPSTAAITPVSTTQDSGFSAADVDLIEKHWIDRAKVIVSETIDDPHKQQKEINKEKVEYIKKRFNKTIPIDSSSKP